MSPNGFSRFVSCSSVDASCAAASTVASCTPLTLDMSSREWAGLCFEGNPNLATWWLSSRSWMWPLLQDAMRLTRDAVMAAFGIEPTFVLNVTWHDSARPEATLTVVAPVFACDYVDAFDRGHAFLDGPDQGPVPPHAAAIAALQEAHFDGAVVGDIWVAPGMWSDPAASSDADSTRLVATSE